MPSRRSESACVLHEGRLYPFETVDAAYEFYERLDGTAAAAPAPQETGVNA